jgi:hypothetical protein
MKEPQILTVEESQIYDDLIVELFEQHWADEVACSLVDCDKTAVWHVKMRCCPIFGDLCDQHESRLTVTTAAHAAAGQTLACTCGHRFSGARCLEDVAIVTEL